MLWHVTVVHLFLLLNCISLYECITFFIIHSSVDRGSSCFQFGDIMYNVAMNTHVTAFVMNMCFHLLWLVPSCKIAGSSLYLAFKKSALEFSKWLYHFIFPQECEDSYFSTSLRTLGIIFFMMVIVMGT